MTHDLFASGILFLLNILQHAIIGEELFESGDWLDARRLQPEDAV